MAFPDAAAAVVATVLYARVFGYIGIPEQINTDQVSQFESQLIAELLIVSYKDKTNTTFISHTS